MANPQRFSIDFDNNQKVLLDGSYKSGCTFRVTVLLGAVMVEIT
jgi:hypothetical protein